MTATITEARPFTEVEPTTGGSVGYELTTEDHEGPAAHIVMVPPGEDDQTPQAYVLRARIEGFPITALCGHTWVPFRDPGVLPKCSPCVEVYHEPGENREDREELPDA